MKSKGKRKGSGMQTVTVCISTILVLSVLGVMVLFFLSAGQLSAYVRENISFSLAFQEGTTEKEIQTMCERLKELPYVHESAYISKEEILKEQTELLGTDPVSFLGYNPFTSSVELKLKSDYTQTDSIAKIKRLLLKNKKITDVAYHKELVEVVNRNIHRINAALSLFAIVMMVISYSLINSLVRLTIFSQRFLLHTMKLVGAGWGFIRRPFMWQGFWIGVVSGASANVLLGGMLYWLLKNEPGFGRIIDWKMIGETAAAVQLFGLAVVLLCVFLSVNKFLRMKANELYYM